MTIRRDSLLSFAILFLLGSCLSAQTVTEFPLPPDSNAGEIVAGPDGNLWFTGSARNTNTGRAAGAIGRITPAGSITQFLLPTSIGGPVGIASGPDGNLWFTQTESEDNLLALIGRITTAGVITEFPTPHTWNNPFDITVGPEGNLWFTESAISPFNKVGRITTSGAITEFQIPTRAVPIGIAAGPDGNLWFTASTHPEGAGKIGRITTSGVVTEFPLPSGLGYYPASIAAGPDGNLWFTESPNKIGRITTSGVITEFSIPTPSSVPGHITAGPDGNLWFTASTYDAHTGAFIGAEIGRITTTGSITEFPIATGESGLGGITAGPDGNVWFTEFRPGKIGRITVARAPAIDSRVLPVVGSTVGVGGSFFRTAVQLNNSTTTPIGGRVVFHPSGLSGTDSDRVLLYSLSPGQTQSIADLLPAMGRSGLGSADVEVTSGTMPIVTARVFNDAGATGTSGFTEELMRAEDALRPGSSGVLLLPTNLVSFRFNVGVRTLDAGAAATLTLRDAAGVLVATVSRAFPATYHEQQGAIAFLGVTALPPGGSISIAVTSGAAIFYGATVDNTTGDPSLQVARSAP
jgi:streptogramin lyase